MWDGERVGGSRRTRRLTPGVLALSIMTTVATVLTLSISPAIAASGDGSAAECSGHQLDELAWNSVLTMNGSRAATLANESSTLIGAVNTLPNGTTLSFNSVYYDWNMSQSSCSVALESVNVAYDLTTPGGTGQLVVSENPFASQVVGVVEQAPSLTSAPHQPEALWTGEIFSLATQMTNPLVLAYWEVPYENYPSWGCTYVGAFVCELSPWAGLTATTTGGSPNEGIAQAGTDTFIDCPIPNFDCSRIFIGWYEFFPADPISCLSVSPGNEVYSVDAYDDGQYYLLLYNLNTGQSCGAHESMTMGSPNWAWVVSENPGDGQGGYFESPTYGSVNFENIVVGNDLNVAPLYDGDDTAGYHMSNPTPAPPDYDTGPCAGIGSCFNIDQD